MLQPLAAKQLRSQKMVGIAIGLLRSQEYCCDRNTIAGIAAIMLLSKRYCCDCSKGTAIATRLQRLKQGAAIAAILARSNRSDAIAARLIKIKSYANQHDESLPSRFDEYIFELCLKRFDYHSLQIMFSNVFTRRFGDVSIYFPTVDVPRQSLEVSSAQ